MEGESASALKIAMTCHKYANDLELVEEAIAQTYQLLFKYNMLDDCERLLDPALKMLIELRSTGKEGMEETK